MERRLSELTREENFIGKSVNLRKLNLNSKYIYIYTVVIIFWVSMIDNYINHDFKKLPC